MSASLISRSGSSAFSAIRVRGHWPTKILVEGEELETNLLQASQRGPASSSVLDEVFGTHNGPYFDIDGKLATARAYRRALASCGLRSPGILREVQHQ